MRSLVPALLLVAAGCGADVVDGSSADPRCNPLAPAVAPAGQSCFLPYPSSAYLVDDPATATGKRVSIPIGVLPKNQIGRDFDVSRFNVLDGFSPATPIVADLGVHLDGKRLPSNSLDFTASMQPSSTVQLIDYETGERVPLFAEVDANVHDAAPQVLLIHPALRLRPAARYVVVLRGLTDDRGAAVHVAPFDALVSGNVGPRLAPLVPRYREILARVDKAGIARTDLTLAWDFSTASDAQSWGHVVSMRDRAFARWDKDRLGVHFTLVEDRPGDAHVARHLRGTFDVPSFLTDNTSLYAGLALDEHHQPVDTGTNYPATLEVLVPNCALNASHPVPVIVFGHGLFGAASQIDTEQQRRTADALCMVEVATYWTGLSSPDQTAVVARVFSDFDTFWQPTDRLQQGVVNFLVLARLAARHLGAEPALARPDGSPIVDGKEVYYFGISEGGIMGHTFLALSPDVSRGALNVGAGAYSLMMTRSGDFLVFKGILDNTYPSQEDQEILFALSQLYFDYSDPISFAPHLLAHTFPDEKGVPLPPRHALLQESHYDAQVPNVASRVLARTAGYPQLTPTVEPVWGLAQATGPLDAAYTQWDVKPMPLPPEGNTPPSTDNGAHDAIGKLPQLIEQLRRLFRPDGKVEQTCDGACVFPGAM